ncbi:MAG: 2-oxoacid:acceptor oxidoreductase family protein [Candidatus Omnitrophica bacterium]|nr:2-oxoacid:acceptor oxidoreductase family protein [Candidatus Omnitrophota bacterium]
MTERIIIAGAGGQGIMLLGKVLAEAAMKEGKFVTWLPAYGAEVRGGTSHCMLVISDEEIGSPYVSKADTLIIMNSPSLEKFKGRLAAGGLLVLNSSLAKPEKQGKVKIIQHPFSDKAIEMGNIKIANMIALGCYVGLRKSVSIKNVLGVIEDIAPKGKKDLVLINQEALKKGVAL